jgi:hypothetical protein
VFSLGISSDRCVRETGIVRPVAKNPAGDRAAVFVAEFGAPHRSVVPVLDHPVQAAQELSVGVGGGGCRQLHVVDLLDLCYGPEFDGEVGVGAAVLVAVELVGVHDVRHIVRVQSVELLRRRFFPGGVLWVAPLQENVTVQEAGVADQADRLRAV